MSLCVFRAGSSCCCAVGSVNIWCCWWFWCCCWGGCWGCTCSCGCRSGLEAPDTVLFCWSAACWPAAASAQPLLPVLLWNRALHWPACCWGCCCSWTLSVPGLNAACRLPPTAAVAVLRALLFSAKRPEWRTGHQGETSAAGREGKTGGSPEHHHSMLSTLFGCSCRLRGPTQATFCGVQQCSQGFKVVSIDVLYALACIHLSRSAVQLMNGWWNADMHGLKALEQLDSNRHLGASVVRWPNVLKTHTCEGRCGSVEVVARF